MIFFSLRKPVFTLLELLVVLFIISFGIILTGIKIKDFYREQRFLSETQQVLSHLIMAQDLMMIMDTDVQVKFAPHPESKNLQIWLEVEKPLEQSWARLVERKLSLVAIRSLGWKKRGPIKELTLQFSLGKMSQGKLTLFDGEGKGKKQEKFDIELLGYPNPIGIKPTKPQEQTKAENSEVFYPVEVYEKLQKSSQEKQVES